MAVPNTNTFSLQDVATELALPATTDLIACFTTANGRPSYWWDDLYVGSKNSLSNFRNYGFNTDIAVGNVGSQYDNMTTYIYDYNGAGVLLGGGPGVIYHIWKSFNASDPDALACHWIPNSGYEILGGVVGTLGTACLVKVGSTTIDFSPCTITGSYEGSTYVILIQNLQSDTLIYPTTQGTTEYRVQPLNASGQVLVATLASDTQAPTQVTGVAISQETKNSFRVSWNASTDNVGVTGYRVYITYGSNPPTALQYDTTSLLYDVTGMTTGVQYSVTVSARDAAGNWSTISTTVNVTLVPAVPSQVTGVMVTYDYGAEIGLVWNPNQGSEGVTGYELSWSLNNSTWSSSNFVAADGWIFTNTNTLYYIRVRAYAGAGNYGAWSSTIIYETGDIA